MLKFGLPAAMMVILFSCNSGDPTSSHSSDADTINYSYSTIEKQLFDCEDENNPCARVFLQSIDLKNEGEAIQMIEQKVQERFINIYGNEGDSLLESIDEVIDLFLLEYESILTEMPDYKAPWSLERSVEVNFNDHGIFGVSFVDFSYTGGAHGNSLLLFSNFDVNTGDEISLNSLCTVNDSFNESMENIFRNSQNISKTTSLEDAGFWFNEGFYVPDNYFFSSKGIHFFYNPYEVAPYASGAIELYVNWKEIAPFLNSEWANLKDLIEENLETETVESV
jgi:hypothetical protein